MAKMMQSICGILDDQIHEPRDLEDAQKKNLNLVGKWSGSR